MNDQMMLWIFSHFSVTTLLANA